MKFFLLLSWLVIFGVFFQHIPPETHAGFSVPASNAKPNSEEKPQFTAQLASHSVTKAMHSAAAVELDNHQVMAFWYGGTREGAKDVAIYATTFDPKTATWSQERPIITRAFTEESTRHYVKKLGNPVVIKKRDGSIWLFYVSVAIGGWSTSAINVTLSLDDGVTWSPPKRLIASPVFNLSYLIKSPPFLMQDGDIGLPVYHEMAGKFSEWLKIDAQQAVVYKSRISAQRYAIQPAVVPLSESDAICFMRNSGKARRVFAAQTHDRGITWSTPYPLALKNPNSAVASMALSDHELIMVLNNSDDERDDLSLAYSKDSGKTWDILALFEDGQQTKPNDAKKIEFSYPYLIQTRNGDFHLLYTWYKLQIKHILFNRAWLRQKISSIPS